MGTDWSLTGNLTVAEKGTGHPTTSCRWPSVMGAAAAPIAKLSYERATSVWFIIILMEKKPSKRLNYNK